MVESSVERKLPSTRHAPVATNRPNAISVTRDYPSETIPAARAEGASVTMQSHDTPSAIFTQRPEPLDVRTDAHSDTIVSMDTAAEPLPTANPIVDEIAKQPDLSAQEIEIANVLETIFRGEAVPSETTKFFDEAIGDTEISVDNNNPDKPYLVVTCDSDSEREVRFGFTVSRPDEGPIVLENDFREAAIKGEGYGTAALSFVESMLQHVVNSSGREIEIAFVELGDLRVRNWLDGNGYVNEPSNVVGGKRYVKMIQTGEDPPEPTGAVEKGSEVSEPKSDEPQRAAGGSGIKVPPTEPPGGTAESSSDEPEEPGKTFRQLVSGIKAEMEHVDQLVVPTQSDDSMEILEEEEAMKKALMREVFIRAGEKFRDWVADQELNAMLSEAAGESNALSSVERPQDGSESHGDSVVSGERQIRRVEPLIRIVGDVTLIGVDHGSAQYFRDNPIYERVIIAIGNADHLLLEGQRGLHRDNVTYKPGNTFSFEDLAYKNFVRRGKSEDIHTLEQNMDYFSLARQAGFDTNTALLSADIESVRFLASLLPEEQELATRITVGATLANIPSLSLSADEYYVRMWALTKRYELFQKQYPQGTQLNNAFIIGADLISEYMQNVRDAQVIGPELIVTVPQLIGEKVVILGQSHMNNLEGALLGHAAPEVGGMGWNQYYETLEPHEKIYCDLVIKVANLSL